MVENQTLEYFTNQFSGDIDTLEKISEGENIIYSFMRDNVKCILRITGNYRRTLQQIKAETEWICFVNKNNGPAVKLVQTVDNELVKSHGEYFAFCYVMAENKFPIFHEFDEQFYKRYGGAAGKLNQLAKVYKPIHEIRHDWENDDDLLDCLAFDGDDKIIANRCKEIIDRLRKIKKTSDNFGLIHADLHSWNLGLHKGEIQIFDFDDSQYDFYVREIAVILFYYCWHPNYIDSILAHNPNDIEKPVRFLKAVIEGYEAEAFLDRTMLVHIQDYLKFQRIILYKILKKDEDEGEDMGKWYDVMIKWRKEIIEDENYLNIDFENVVTVID
ncbi:MAG: phosphotransferase [Candidatus Delongbacteria bacterium]|nr:phosphotransferase [Candidatus Delongbacteria bacterium]MBN2835000.1 phosphotransferase [Candidatus Delongbacteria bacterium]